MTLETLTRADLLAALAWQVELGADEAIGDAPVNRFELAAPRRLRARAAATGARPGAGAGRGAGQRRRSRPPAATSRALRAAMQAFDGCALKHGARNLVFADGNPAARLMVIGEAPGRDEDLAGLPFVGRSGQLLDRMLAAIGLSRRAEDPAAAAYITNTLPWRPPQNREPSADEVAAMLPFLHRHIELKAPEVLLLVGAAAVQDPDADRRRASPGCAAAGSTGAGVPVIATFHPAALLRDGLKKREAWADLLSLKARLDAGR